MKHCTNLRQMQASALAEQLVAARNYTLQLFDAFAAAGMDRPHNVPRLPIVNPPLWELGHLIWFAEWYCCRGAVSSAPDAAQRPSLFPDADQLFDSNLVAHTARWDLSLPEPAALRAWSDQVLEHTVSALAACGDDAHTLYPFRLALAHEDMHGEAFLATMQTLDVAPPQEAQERASMVAAGGQMASIRFPGGTVQIGSPDDGEFVFDNEKWAHPLRLDAFEIDTRLISQAQYGEFVADGGYQRAQFWSPAGREWLMQQERSAPRDWRRAARNWNLRRFGRDVTMALQQPVRHVSLFEAQAYCTWAGRRLPSEAEWECAASSGHPGFRWGDLWEWTHSAFLPYPGFAADRYQEYSKPWFATHQSVRGASFATPARLRSVRFRNFYLPQRDDLFLGFRTCAR